MGTVKSFITQPTQRVISKNFAMGVVKTAIIAPINAAVGMKLDEDSIAKINECWNSSKKISVEFSTKITAMFFIQEAIQLCEVDGSYDEAEKNEIRNLAEELGISEEKIVAIEKWVQTGIVWRQQGEALIKALSED